jgi:hypothetical protein
VNSQLYPKARQRFGKAQLNWEAHDFRVVFMAATYNPDFTDEFISEVSPLSRIATSSLLTNLTITDGIARADPIEFGLIADSRQISQAILYRDTGDESTSPVVFYFGEEDLVGEPFVPVGLEYFIYMPEGGLFRL